MVAIPNSVTSIGESAFYECSSLTSVTIPNSVTSIRESAFHGCSSLTSVTIPNSVKSIGNNAFHWCSGIATVYIPGSVQSIGEYTFDQCRSLTSIYYDAENPINASSNIFMDYTYNKAALYVRDGIVEKCKMIDPWKNFSWIETYDPAGMEDVTVDIDRMAPMEVYNLGGLYVGSSLDNLPAGVYIVRQGGKAKRIAVR